MNKKLSQQTSREDWIRVLDRIARPVLSALSEERLRRDMPVERHAEGKNRENHTQLEGFARTYIGIAPWLELEKVPAAEKALQAEYRAMVIKGLDFATNPESVDFMNFREGLQVVVDAAFLCSGLLRSWNSVWLKLEADVQARIITCVKTTRWAQPFPNNWLLFSAIIEAFLARVGSDWDPMRIDYAIRQHEQWYLGDGMYGDGPEFHWDYYNSFVIQPMLIEVLETIRPISDAWESFEGPIHKRALRYAEIQEQMISPEGTYPAIGRSLAYRFGAFHHLAFMALRSELPEKMSPASVRCAMSAVISRFMDYPSMFDDKGWLTIGLYGHQPEVGQPYISTGSLYLCLCALLPLGLAERDPFWGGPDEDWSSRRILGWLHHTGK